MQGLTEAFTAHLAQEVTTLATCWKIIRKDSEVLCFTDHDVDLLVDGATYLAASGITPSAVSSQMGLAVDNLELEGAFTSEAITEEDVRSGRYDHAAVDIFMVDYTAPDMGRLHLKSGWLGEVTLHGGMFVAEIRGLSSVLQQSIGQVYTSGCRAKLGDGRCGVNLASYTVMGAVTAVETNYSFTDSGRAEDGNYFSYGLMRFTSGLNDGLSMEVREFTEGGEFRLFLPLPHAVQVGDEYMAIAGCDKRFDTCVGRFNNAVNFRGEPHVPGTDRLMETSATRSS